MGGTEDFMHSIKSSLKNVYALGKVWSTRDMVKNKIWFLSLYTLDAKSINRGMTQSIVFQNSHSGVKVEDDDM